MIAYCPDCGVEININTRPKLKMVVPCIECNDIYQIISLNPVELDWYYGDDEEDDWQEEDDEEEEYSDSDDSSSSNRSMRYNLLYKDKKSGVAVTQETDKQKVLVH